MVNEAQGNESSEPETQGFGRNRVTSAGETGDYVLYVRDPSGTLPYIDTFHKFLRLAHGCLCMYPRRIFRWPSPKAKARCEKRTGPTVHNMSLYYAKPVKHSPLVPVYFLVR